MEDDGVGIRSGDLARIGGRYESSKVLNQSGMGSAGSYGFRGEGQSSGPLGLGELMVALSSIAALGLVEVTTRAKGSRRTMSKVIKVKYSYFPSH